LLGNGRGRRRRRCLRLMLGLLCGGRGALRGRRHVLLLMLLLLLGVRWVGSVAGVVCEHRVAWMPRRCVGVVHLRRRTVKHMALWVVWRLRVNDAAVEVGVLVGVVCVQRGRAVGRCRRIYRNRIHWCDRSWACVW
jgi:hypothetical protein